MLFGHKTKAGRFEPAVPARVGSMRLAWLRDNADEGVVLGPRWSALATSITSNEEQERLSVSDR